METAFSSKLRQVTVIHTEYLNPQLKKIRFAGDLAGTTYSAGQAIVLKVNDTSYRNYTPCLWDSEAGVAEVLFHLHGNGPGSELLSDLQKGDTLLMGLPRGFRLHRKDNRYHFFFGDETTLGLFMSLKEAIQAKGQLYIGLLELDEQAKDIPDQLGLMTDITDKTSFTASQASAFLDSLDRHIWNLWKSGTFYLMGNARSIQLFRSALKAQGIPARNIVTQPYWAQGKIGL